MLNISPEESAHELLDKGRKVIHSCTTTEQLNMAATFVHRMILPLNRLDRNDIFHALSADILNMRLDILTPGQLDASLPTK